MKRKEVELSARMKALTKLVSVGRIVCDVGCDHGFVSIYLVQKEIAPKVLAMDVRSGPLSQAQSHIVEYGLEQKIETRLSDGLQNLKIGEADCMICAGMGGPLMVKILQEGREKALAMKELILQPQSEIAQFRQYLRNNGYHIIKEDMVFEDGKYYPMMKVVPETYDDPAGCVVSGGCSDSKKNAVYDEQHVSVKKVQCVPTPEEIYQMFDLYGQYLLEHRHPVLKQYLEHSENVTEVLINKLKEQESERAQVRLPELESEIKLIRAARRYFDA